MAKASATATPPDPRVYSGKQAHIFNECAYGTAKFVLIDGPVRSGKTAAALDGFAAHALLHGGEYLLAAPTIAQIRKVLIPSLQDVFGKALVYRSQDKGATLGGSTFHIYSGSTEASEGSLRGLTLRGAFIDEATQVPESFWGQAIARCSLPNAKIVACTNPDSPYHWLKRKWIDRADDEVITRIHTVLADNPSLTEEYKQDVLGKLTGAEYARNVMGEWVEAEGAVYPGVHEWVQPFPAALEQAEPDARWIAVDAGEVNATHALLIELYDRTRWVVREWRHSRSESGSLSVDQKAAQMLAALLPREGTAVSAIHVDPAAQDMVAALRRHSPGIPVQNAVNDVLLGIQQVRNEFESERLWVADRCRQLVVELATYAWDQRAADRGVQKPVKRDDHGPDALRYHIASTIREHRRLVIVDNRLSG